MRIRAGRKAAQRRGRSTPLLVALLLAGLAAFGGSASAPTAVVPPAVRQQQLTTADGLSRSYRLFRPLTLDRTVAVPLVLVLAGVGNTGEQMVGVTMFDRLAAQEKFVVAYPEGLNRTWNAGYCCPNGGPPGPDDVAFLSEVIDDVQVTERIDPARVFAVGFSGGAIMVHRLACDLAGRIAGVASVAGAMILDDCQPSEPVSVIEVHGTADELVPYEGGLTAGAAAAPSPPTEDVMQRWAELNACSAPPAAAPDGVVTTRTWTGCAEGTSVRLITVEGAGHTWFAPGFGPINGAVDTTQAVWDFLRALPAGWPTARRAAFSISGLERLVVSREMGSLPLAQPRAAGQEGRRRAAVREPVSGCGPACLPRPRRRRSAERPR